MTQEQKKLNLHLLDQVDGAISAASAYLAKNKPDSLINIPEHIEPLQTDALFDNQGISVNNEGLFQIVINWSSLDQIQNSSLPYYLFDWYRDEENSELRLVQTTFPKPHHVLPEFVVSKSGLLIEIINYFIINMDGIATKEVSIGREDIENLGNGGFEKLMQLDFDPEPGQFTFPMSGHDFEYLESHILGIGHGRYLPEHVIYFGSQGLTRARS